MPTTTSSNFTSLYGASDGTVVPTSPYGNANVVSLLNVGTDGANTVGNITSAGRITATGNIQTSAYFIGDGSLLTNLAGGSYGNANVAAFLPTYTGAMTAMTGNVTTTANISGNYFVGNGSLLTGITGTGTYGNANVAANLAAFANNPILTTGNITAGNFIGSGAALSSITGGNVTGTVANATFATSAATATTATSATTAGTVTTAAQPNITSVGTLTSVATTGNISATGNITGNYYIGNGSLLTGITGTGTYGNANVAANLAAFANNPISTTGNITSGNLLISNVGGGAPRIIGYNGAKLSFSGPSGLLYLLGNDDSVSSSTLELGVLNAVGNITGGNINTGAQVSATGNISGNYFIGNGSLLTGITGTGTYGNANVVALLSSFGSNTINTTGAIDGANITGLNIFTSGANGTVNTSRLNASTLSLSGNVVCDLVVTGNNAGGTIGNIRALGSVSANGNIQAGNITSLGQLNGGTINSTVINSSTITTLGNVDIGGQLDVAGEIFAPLSLISGGNITATGTGVGFIRASANISAGGNVISAGYVTAGGNITSAGNIAASFFIGNGSQLTGITTTYGNSNVAAFLPTYTGNLAGDSLLLNTATGTALVQASTLTASIANISGYIYAGSGATSSTIITTGGGIEGNIIIGNSYVSTAGYVTAVGNVIGGNIRTAGQVSATGNITGSYFIGNGSQLTGIATNPGGSNTQLQFNNNGVFDGNANVTFNVSTGNLDIYNNRLTTANVTTTVQPFDDSVVSGTVVNPGRIIFGTGVNGNLSAEMDATNWLRGSLFLVNQNITKGDNGRRTSGASFDIPVTLSGNLANASTRITATRQSLTIGGANVYGMTSTNVNAWPSAVNASVIAGTNGNIIVGNISMAGTQVANFGTQTNGTSTIASAIAVRNDFSGNIANCTGMLVTSALSAVGNTVSVVQNAATNHNTNYRSSTNYFFLNNTDDVAQNKLGSLLRYTEFNYGNNSTSGGITVSKNNGQVQQINLTGNVSGITYADFVSSASDGTNTDEQSDTVTMIFNQGATGNFGVTFPTGAAYKYAGNVTALQSVAANSVSLVSVSAIRIGGTTTYLTTISPGFV